MGCDVPDVLPVVVYGAQDLCAAFQKGSRAARNLTLQGTIVSLIEHWASEGISSGRRDEDEDSKYIEGRGATPQA